jgi:hypothetical protein
VAYDELLDTKSDLCAGKFKKDMGLKGAPSGTSEDAYDDKEFMNAFAASELPVHQLVLVYEGWKLALESFKNNIAKGGKK